MNAIPSATAPAYRLVDMPPARQIVVTFLDLSAWRHHIFGFLEVDVTRARQCLAEHEARTGERLSFTGYIIYCLARAVDQDKRVQGYLKGRKQIMLFDDVDVGIMIEHRLGGGRAPIGHVIRAANRKTFLEIHREIRDRQTAEPRKKEMPGWMRVALRLPGPFQKGCLAVMRWAMRRDPAGTWVSMAGTVGVTAVGMFGEGGGWGLGAPDRHTLSLVVGGIGRKPAVVGDKAGEERIEARDFLSLTLTFDHDVVDGAPAARFTERLKELIETGAGLDQL
ncbi:MAG: 2-oxo acid dehydrogenase subunit E2 [Anaerolineae bacterium]|jgi:pyruvate/2-oxoglutarate dehydrogenase complex dihydrolipoamide acyltransferase (E2) component|nr:2-oxo acid dehydrogenase subunit E2 [Anaerolineae bacterium]